MSSERIASMIRHLATFFGGMMAVKSTIPPEYLEAIIGGLAALGAVLWGVVSKTPVATPPALPKPPQDGSSQP